MQKGEMIVMGSDEVQIELGGFPIKLLVDFSDGGEIIVPCDPHQNDKLNWSIHQHILTINWTVSGIREIKWKAWFYWSEVT